MNTNHLEQTLFAKKTQIEDFFAREFALFTAPFYCSVDLRYAGFKLSGIDTNLFPAGFNNLARSSSQLLAEQFSHQIKTICPDSKKILILSESNTRNLAYLQSVYCLKQICNIAGFEVKVASFLPENHELTTKNKESIMLYSLKRKGDFLVTSDGFHPCAILLNNDLSSGLPEIMQGISQTIIPSEQLGWQHRLKSVHFEHYQNIAELFSSEIGLDSWLINPLFRKCGKIDFMKKSGEDCLAENVANLLGLIQTKYQQYQINTKPYVIIKDDAGTYGMGIIAVSSAAQVYKLNRKQRKKMNYGKSKNTISKVILQEGVTSIETIKLQEKNAPIEPVVYLANGKMVGLFYRAHKDKDAQSVLNTPGMEFIPVNITKNNDDAISINDQLLYAYSVVARIATLAASFEMNQINQKKV